jgi:Acetyltransferase (GNAT) family
VTPPGAIVPVSRVPITVRAATIGDYPFIDRLQDMHSKALGFMPKAQLEGKIARGEVLVAEDDGTGGARLPIGYCISSDRYFKHDDVGIIYQMNLSPGVQRKLVGATLLRAVFERAPYGCRLFCCWCAQDLNANHFWESLGFVPLAFRAGAGGNGRRPQARVHIFWQRRIREGDTTTPYWFPAKTDGGHMREDRIVLPIPPGVHWKDPMPILLPEAQKALPDKSSGKMPKPHKTPTLMPPTRRRVQFGAAPITPAPEPVAKTKPAKPKREKVKADPVLVAKARELRDRWLEKVNEDPSILLSEGKYAVTRQLTPPSAPPQALLPAA